MGYTTEFEGSLALSRNLAPSEKDYLDDFLDCRHMQYNVATLPESQYTVVSDWGIQGKFYTGTAGEDAEITDCNNPPEGVPGLWCEWRVVDEGEGHKLLWSEGEKFYAYVEWLQFLINEFFTPWGITLSGDIFWRGESRCDFGRIEVAESVVVVTYAERKKNGLAY